jgi:hypothetical protein
LAEEEEERSQDEELAEFDAEVEGEEGGGEVGAGELEGALEASGEAEAVDEAEAGDREPAGGGAGDVGEGEPEDGGGDGGFNEGG